MLAAGVVLMQRVVEPCNHARAVLKRGMFGDLLDALAIDPDLAAVVETVEKFAAGIGQDLRGSADGGFLAATVGDMGFLPICFEVSRAPFSWINRNLPVGQVGGSRPLDVGSASPACGSTCLLLRANSVRRRLIGSPQGATVPPVYVRSSARPPYSAK